MLYGKFGRTGIEVSAQCLGTMMFGPGGNSDPDACIRMVRRSLDAGINIFDTADIYARGGSEEILGKALDGVRDHVVLGTKCYNPMSNDRNSRGGSRRWIVRALEDSLHRLRTDYVDLYQLHRHDHDADLDETLGALSDLVRAGKVRYLGCSSFPAEWIVEAQWVSDRHHHQRFVSEQPQYSIFARSVETAVLPTCQRHGMAVLPWSPLAGGWLTGKYRRGADTPEGSRFSRGSLWAQMMDARDLESDPRLEIVEQLAKIADQAGLSMLELSLGFVSSHPAVTSTIIGPKTEEQLNALLAASDVVLPGDVLDAIDEVVKPGTDAPRIAHFAPNPAMEASNRRRREARAG